MHSLYFLFALLAGVLSSPLFSGETFRFDINHMANFALKAQAIGADYSLDTHTKMVKVYALLKANFHQIFPHANFDKNEVHNAAKSIAEIFIGLMESSDKEYAKRCGERAMQEIQEVRREPIPSNLSTNDALVKREIKITSIKTKYNCV